MINVNIGTKIQAKVNKNEYDSYGGFAGSGTIGMGRSNKRDGRNPSTGLRTSRKYGIRTVFETGFPPLTDSEKQLIY